MKRFFLLLMSIAALGLVLGAGACKKGEEKAAEGEAKPAEGGEAAGEEKAAEEKPAEEKAAEGEEKPAEGEAKEGGEAAAGDSPKTGIEECDKLIETYVKCDKLPQSARDAFLQNADAWKKALEAGGDAAKTQLVESCKQAAEAAKQSLSALGC